MRFLVAMVVGLGGVALLASDLMLAVAGFADQNVANNVYVVGFARAGDDCGAERLELDVADGSPLVCTVAPPMEETEVDLPGFTADQNAAVESLAAQLGSDGLSAAEQRRIQEEVDRYAAEVPADERPYPDKAFIAWNGLWGASLGWLGVATVAVPVIGYIVVMRALDAARAPPGGAAPTSRRHPARPDLVPLRFLAGRSRIFPDVRMADRQRPSTPLHAT